MLENTKLVSLLDDPSLLAKKAYVAGEWVSAKDGKTFDVVNPATGEVIAKQRCHADTGQRRPNLIQAAHSK